MTLRRRRRTLLAVIGVLLAAGPADGQVDGPNDSGIRLDVSVEEWRDGAAIRGDLAEFLAPRLSLAVERPASLGDYVPAVQLFGVLIEKGRVVSSRRSRPFLPDGGGGLAVHQMGRERLRAFLLACCVGTRPPVAAVTRHTAANRVGQEGLDAAIAAIAATGAIDGVFHPGAAAPPKVDWRRHTVVVLAAVPERGGAFRARPVALVLEGS